MMPKHRIFDFNPFPWQALVFTCLQYKYFENTVGKGEIALNKQFFLFPQCFLPIQGTFNFQQIRNCHQHTLSVWKNLKFVAWERVKEQFIAMVFSSGAVIRLRIKSAPKHQPTQNL